MVVVETNKAPRGGPGLVPVSLPPSQTLGQLEIQGRSLGRRGGGGRERGSREEDFCFLCLSLQARALRGAWRVSGSFLWQKKEINPILSKHNIIIKRRILKGYKWARAMRAIAQPGHIAESKPKAESSLQSHLRFLNTFPSRGLADFNLLFICLRSCLLCQALTHVLPFPQTILYLLKQL